MSHGDCHGFQVICFALIYKTERNLATTLNMITLTANLLWRLGKEMKIMFLPPKRLYLIEQNATRQHDAANIALLWKEDENDRRDR